MRESHTGADRIFVLLMGDEGDHQLVSGGFEGQ